MGFLDELKDKAEAFGEKAKESFGGATDQTENVIENAKDRFDKDDTLDEKAGEAADSSTEAVSDAAEGMKHAAADTSDSAKSAAEDAKDSKQGSW
jgi:hypothetical protein